MHTIQMVLLNPVPIAERFFDKFYAVQELACTGQMLFKSSRCLGTLIKVTIESPKCLQFLMTSWAVHICNGAFAILDLI